MNKKVINSFSKASVLVTLLLSGCAVFTPDEKLSVFDRLSSLDSRMQMIERQLSAQGQLELLNNFELMQEELRTLRGQVEQQGFALTEGVDREKDLYRDLDQRLRQLEGGEAPNSHAQGSLTGGNLASVASETEQQQYQAAFDLLKKGKYREAIKSFDNFIAQNPDSLYTANAFYWRAEGYYVIREFSKALSGFSEILQLYKKSPKAPDAMLKTAYVHYELADWKEARRVLNDLIVDYPKSNAATLAKKRLERMDREGR